MQCVAGESSKTINQLIALADSLTADAKILSEKIKKFNSLHRHEGEGPTRTARRNTNADTMNITIMKPFTVTISDMELADG